MLTEPKYILDLENNRNHISRNSDCFNGGKEMNIFITNPREPEITGLRLFLTPFVPNQNLGLDYEFKNIVLEDDFKYFDDQHGIKLTASLIPEFSYKISGSFKTDFGFLSASDELILQGEFGNMMKKVGCYIRHNYVIKNASSLFSGKVDSSIACAQSCFESENCTDGWKYQIGTKQCYFYQNLEDLEYEEYKEFQPGKFLSDQDLTFGWTSGHKSCSVPGKEIKIGLNFLKLSRYYSILLLNFRKIYFA